jgi:serine/threonine protein kinase
MEYCDCGSLATALRRGVFAPVNNTNAAATAATAAARWAAVLATAREVCSALAYLHGPAVRVAHGDVQPGNVLLRGAAQGRWDGGRGFVALLGDFGQSAPIGCGGGGGSAGEDDEDDEAAAMPTPPLLLPASPLTAGALSHAPPEGVGAAGGGGGATPAADLFAFATLLWELSVGRCAFRGVAPAELLAEKVRGGGSNGPTAEERLLLPVLLVASGGGGPAAPPPPPALVALVRACWRRDPSARPTAEEALSRLDDAAVEALGADWASMLMPGLLSRRRKRDE